MSNSEPQDEGGKPNQNETGEESKRKRRPKNDDNSRDYICGCKKSYLSYPALYTHIKTKHGGKAPDKIQMPHNQKGNKLKKYDFKQPTEINQKKEEEQSTLKQMIQFLNGIHQNKTIKSYSINQLFENFSVDDKNPFLQSITQWEIKNFREEWQQNGSLNTSIDRVFAKFILNLSSKVEKQILIEIIIILIIWRKTINKKYRKFEKQTYGIYSKEASANNLIQIVNDLILIDFPDHERHYSNILANSKMLTGTKKEYHLCHFINYFSKWLFSQKYTNSKIKFRENEED